MWVCVCLCNLCYWYPYTHSGEETTAYYCRLLQNELLAWLYILVDIVLREKTCCSMTVLYVMWNDFPISSVAKT